MDVHCSTVDGGGESVSRKWVSEMVVESEPSRTLQPPTPTKYKKSLMIKGNGHRLSVWCTFLNCFADAVTRTGGNTVMARL